MDKVQYYAIALFTLGFVASFVLDGKEKTQKHFSFKSYILSALLSLPLYGRIFGWW